MSHDSLKHNIAHCNNFVYDMWANSVKSTQETELYGAVVYNPWENGLPTLFFHIKCYPVSILSNHCHITLLRARIHSSLLTFTHLPLLRWADADGWALRRVNWRKKTTDMTRLDSLCLPPLRSRPGVSVRSVYAMLWYCVTSSCLFCFKAPCVIEVQVSDRWYVAFQILCVTELSCWIKVRNYYLYKPSISKQAAL